MATLTHPALAGTTIIVNDERAAVLEAEGCVRVDVPRVPLGERPDVRTARRRRDAVAVAVAPDASESVDDSAD